MEKNRTKIYLLRSIHTAFAVFFIACLVYIYYAAITRTHNSLLYGAIIILLLEGLTVLFNRGECPLSGLQHRLGDGKGFFNLFMPDALARRMVPFWFIVAVLGFILVWVRW